MPPPHRGHFPGWGRAAAFNAELLTRVGRPSEARDAARMAFRSPVRATHGTPLDRTCWTLGRSMWGRVAACVWVLRRTR